MIKKYKKKPVEFEAVQWDGLNDEEVYNFLEEGKYFYVYFSSDDDLKLKHIKTLEPDLSVSKGDYIIKGVQGEFYPCKPDIFEMTYDVVNEDKKSAKEMFEKLGYVEIDNSDKVISYRHKKNMALYIDIRIKSKTVFKYRLEQSNYGVDRMAYHTTTDELQAINKQLEELGW